MRDVVIQKRWVGVPALLFWIVLLCQVTVLTDTLAIRGLGRVLNAFALAVFGASAVLCLRRSARAPRAVTVACVLVALGISINLVRHVSVDTLGYAGALLPWGALLSVPFMRRYDLAFTWRCFYRFMLVAAVIGLVEYWLAFAGGLPTVLIDTGRGQYLRGVFTIFYQLPDGDINHRLYSVFAEPGTFAMLLLPAIAYALVWRRRIGLAVLLAAFALTRSLGGVVSLMLLVTLYAYVRVRTQWVRSLVLSAVAGGVLASFGGLATAYAAKGASATVREDNAMQFVTHAWPIIRAQPLGLPLMGASLSALSDTDTDYLGSNFGPYTMFAQGGVLALVGYALLLMATTKACVRYFRDDRSRRYATIFLSLPPLLLFVVQRQSVFEQALFAYLFAEPVMRMLAPTSASHNSLNVST